MAQELEKSLIALIKQDIEKKMIASRVILDGLYDFAEEIAREIDVNEYSNYSCEKGCYYCCNVSVSLFAYELFNIINYIKLNNIDVSADIVDAFLIQNLARNGERMRAIVHFCIKSKNIALSTPLDRELVERFFHAKETSVSMHITHEAAMARVWCA